VLIHLNLFAQLGLWGIGGVDYLIKRTLGMRGPDDPGAKTGATILGFIGRVVVWTLTALLILKNAFHQDITALLTGLGVGGIAIALALQNVLGDLFASVTILLDKPFVIGDSVTVGEFTGTIESIGIKTTRLKSINGEQIVMGNADLVNSRLRNFKRIEERRVVFSLGVTYQTPTAKLERIPAILKGIIESTPEVRFDRAHWKNYGDFALNFEAAYFVQKQEYNAMMDAQQSINIAVWRAFEAEGIEFAYPTQTVIVSGARQP
jgi:small-conductance mechanosensitive channel